MPRTYVRKRPVEYDKTCLQSALEDVKNRIPIRAATKQLSHTIRNAEKMGCKPPTHQGSGRSTVLTQDEERCIVVALKFLADCAFLFDHQDVINIAQEYMKLNSKISHLKMQYFC